MLLAEDERVRIVVHNHDAVILGKLHQAFVGFTLGTASRRHVGIIGPHQFHSREVHLLQLLEVGLPTVVLAQIVVHDIRTEDLRERGVGGVAGIGHQHAIPRIHEGQRHVEDTLLRADQRQHLGLPIQIYIVPTLVEESHRLAQFGCSHRHLIAMGIGVVSHLTEFFHRLGRRGHIGTADRKTDNVLTLGVHLGHLL